MRPLAILFAAFYCGLVATPPQAQAKPGDCPAGMIASHTSHRCVAATVPARQNKEQRQLRAQEAQENAQPQPRMMSVGGGY
jgi:hypothetical protein